jgi:hypothetical protein
VIGRDVVARQPRSFEVGCVRRRLDQLPFVIQGDLDQLGQIVEHLLQQLRPVFVFHLLI